MKLAIQEPSIESVTNQVKLFLRIAKRKGIDVKNLVDEVYSEAKKVDAEAKRKAEFKSLDSYYSCTESS